jgi:hypothetical protein
VSRSAREQLIVETLVGRFSDVRHKQGMRADTCILASRMGVDILRHFGIRAKVLPVNMWAYNRWMLEAMERGLEPEEALEEYGPKIRMISVEGSRDGHDWAGHMVVLADLTPVRTGASGLGLIDLTLDQAARPERALYLEPLWIDGVPEDFPAGGQVDAYLEDVKVFVRYKAAFDQGRHYTKAPDWRHPTSMFGIAGRLIREIKTELAAKQEATA